MLLLEPDDLRTYYERTLETVGEALRGGLGDGVSTQARPYIETMLRWVNKRPFRTQEATYVGLAPSETEIGDVVVTVPGFSAPYVLRSVRANERTYQVIGECYLCGVMDGEFLGAVPTVEDLFHLV